MNDVKDILLQVADLNVSFDGRNVVEGLSYTLRRGHTLGIVGESGSGKSVSSLALMGLLPKHATVSGSARLGDTELLSLDEQGFRKVRGKRISMIFQEPMTSLNPVQKCGEQVMEMMNSLTPNPSPKRRGEQRERVIELFEEVLLPRPEKIFSSYPHELSGGQKQRVMIAMALVNRPDIIIADEPTTALDVTVQKTILDLLKQLQQRHGTSIIFISHDLGVIGQVADDILVMYRGRRVEYGAADTVLHHPQQAYTRGLLACRPPLDSHPRRLPTVEEYMSSLTPTPQEAQPHPQTLSTGSGANGGTALISVRDLSVTYTLKKSLFGRPLQTLNAVDNLSFDIHEGETLGLVGESGCGKTTLGRALLRLIDHQSGSISYRGTPLDTLSQRQMRALRPRLQIIFQDPYSSLNPRMTIGEAIAEPLRVHGRAESGVRSSEVGGKSSEGGVRRAEGGVKSSEGGVWRAGIGGDGGIRQGARMDGGEIRSRVLTLMQQVGLDPDWYSRYPHQLSGGQRQRVCIARALILQPELVVCDESVSALDVSVQAQVLNLLNDLKEQLGLTYLFITHDLSVVHYMADRIMVMQKGKIVESGTPDDLFAHPQTDYTRTLLDAIPRIG